MKDLIVFGFKGNISEDVLVNLPDQVKKRFIDHKKHQKLNNHKLVIREVQTEIQPLLQYKIIIGIGAYSGKDQERIRVEQITKNKFRNQPIDKVNDYRIDSPTKNLGVEFKFACGLGNSWCNLYSYLIMKSKSKSAKYNFFHIPNKLEVQRVSKSLSEILLSKENSKSYY